MSRFPFAVLYWAGKAVHFGGMIRMRDVLRKMEELDENGRPVPFSLKYVTYSRKDGKGGDLVEISDAVLTTVQTKSTREAVAEISAKAVVAAMQKQAKTSKNPNHDQNQTRNLMIRQSGQIRKCHVRLIIEFNGKKVIY